MLPALLNFAACQIALRLIGLTGWLRELRAEGRC